MAALMRQFEPTLSVAQSLANVQKLLTEGKGSPFYAHTIGAIRYVVADNGEKGLPSQLNRLSCRYLSIISLQLMTKSKAMTTNHLYTVGQVNCLSGSHYY